MMGFFGSDRVMFGGTFTNREINPLVYKKHFFSFLQGSYNFIVSADSCRIIPFERDHCRFYLKWVKYVFQSSNVVIVTF